MILEGDLLTIDEAAKILSVDKSRVGVLCRQGRFNQAKKVSRIWLIPRKSVEDFERLPPGKKLTPTDKEIIKQALKEAEASKALVSNMA